MLVDVLSYSYEAKWFDFVDGEDLARLKIRPYPASMTETIFQKGKGFVLSGEDSLKVFLYCLTGWESIKGADEKDLLCTDEIKRKIFDFHDKNPLFQKIVYFVIEKAKEFEAVLEGSKKN